MSDEFEIDGYRQLMAALKRFEPDVAKDVRKQFKSVAQKVAEDAKTNAAGIPSRRIPRAIGTTVTNRRAGVKISRKKAPHGSLLEVGQSFRHPVFGNTNVWVTQQTHPFLRPAVQGNRDLIGRVSEQILKDAVARVEAQT